MKTISFKFKYVLAVVFAVILCVCLSIITAKETKGAEVIISGTCGENLTWTLDDEGTLTISGSGKMSNYDSGKAPWYGKSFQTVQIEYGVTSIGTCAFEGCLLNTINIPDSVENIEACAFSESRLETISIPEKVTSIKNNTFLNCRYLKNVTIPESVKSIGEIAFGGCSSLKGIIIPEGVIRIERFAFDDCRNLSKIIIPDSVTYIDTEAFWALPSDYYIYTVPGAYASQYFDPSHIIYLYGTPEIINSDYLRFTTDRIVFAPYRELDIPDYLSTNLDWDDLRVTVSDENLFFYDKGKLVALDEGRGNLVISYGELNATIDVIATYDTVDATGIALGKYTLSLKKGQSEQLEYQCLPENARHNEFIWSSSDNSVATVDDGYITGKRAGTATITVALPDNESIKATCEVTVTAQLEAIVTFEETLPYTIRVGEAKKIMYYLYQSGADNVDLKYTSSNPDIISIDGNGKMTAHGNGTVQITIASGDISKTVAVTAYTYIPITGLSLDKSSAVASCGDVVQLTPIIEPENTTDDRDVRWSSNKESVATVDENGLVTVHGRGLVTITATVGIYSATCNIVCNSHNWDEGKITIKPTCMEEGVRTYACVCGETYTEIIPALGHIWNDFYTVDKEPSYTEEGSESIHCKVCGEIDKTTIRAIPKIPPKLIGTKEELDSIRNDLSENYQLTADIVFSEEDFSEDGDYYNEGKGWLPIGDENNPFTGYFDGNGYTIKGLYVNANGEKTAGLFGYVECGVIENLGVLDEMIIGRASYCGGIACYCDQSTIRNCYSTGSCTVEDGYFGGIAGYIHNSRIESCFNTGNLCASIVGGIVGCAYSSTIENCYNTGCCGGSMPGGIAGETNWSTISNSYNVGGITGIWWIGDIVGYDENNGTAIINCFFPDSNTGMSIGNDSSSVGGCVLETLSSETTFTGFDFNSVWKMGNGQYQFPVLQNVNHIEPIENNTLFNGGNGTFYNPYQISTKGQLDNVRKVNGACYRLETDISFTPADFEPDGAFYNNGQGWSPIGQDEQDYFWGMFDGNGHSIRGLYINTDKQDVGLFGYSRMSSFKNLGMDQCSISSINHSAGSIVGYLYDGRINNCYNTGQIQGNDAGGIIGHSMNVQINNCYNAGTIIASYGAGGIAGNSVGRLNDCYNIGKIISYHDADYAGGIAGIASGSADALTNCYFLDLSAEKGIGFPDDFFFEPNVFSLSEMTVADRFVGFDFEKNWIMSELEDYPFPVLRNVSMQFNPQIVSAELYSVPDKTEYIEQKDYLDVSGGKLSVLYNNWQEGLIDLSTEMVDGFDNAKPGVQTLTVSYDGFTFTYDVLVIHLWDKDYTVDKEPTCTAEGSKSIHCSICDAKQDGSTVTIPATGHAYGNWKVTKEATCTTEGSQEHTCSTCGKKETQTIVAKGHTWEDDYTVDKAAACTEEGYETIHCAICDAIDEMSIREIPVLGHDMFLHEAVEATYEAEGNEAYWECKRCGHYFSDEEGENEIAEGSWVTPKLIPNGWVTIAGEKYYYKDRTAQKGWLSYEGNWYYLDPTTGAMQTGFVKVGSSTYYMAESGIMQTGWFKDNDIWYYANGSGVLQTGWVKSGSTWYYLDPTTGAMQTGFVTIGSTKYYMAASGAMMIGWIKDNGTWYYTNGSGAIQKGWVQSGPTWYYMDPTTGAMQTGWVTIGGTKYYMASSGAMVTGWVKVDDDWYFMNSSGAMQTGWVKSGNSWYYMKSNGTMAASEWVTGYYWINANGTWTYQPVGSWKQNSTGWWFGDTSGWYAKNETLIIADVSYTFNVAGYWVQ